MSSIWTISYTTPSRYNWMFQYYLRLEQLALSWIGTGRLIFSLNYTEEDFAVVADRFVAAAEKMKHDGWWWRDAALTNKAIRRQILKEMICEDGGRSGLRPPGNCNRRPYACRWTGVCSRMSRPGSISSPRIRNSGDFQ